MGAKQDRRGCKGSLFARHGSHRYRAKPYSCQRQLCWGTSRCV